MSENYMRKCLNVIVYHFASNLLLDCSSKMFWMWRRGFCFSFTFLVVQTCSNRDIWRVNVVKFYCFNFKSGSNEFFIFV